MKPAYWGPDDAEKRMRAKADAGLAAVFGGSRSAQPPKPKRVFLFDEQIDFLDKIDWEKVKVNWKKAERLYRSGEVRYKMPSITPIITDGA